MSVAWCSLLVSFGMQVWINLFSGESHFYDFTPMPIPLSSAFPQPRSPLDNGLDTEAVRAEDESMTAKVYAYFLLAAVIHLLT